MNHLHRPYRRQILGRPSRQGKALTMRRIPSMRVYMNCRANCLSGRARNAGGAYMLQNRLRLVSGPGLWCFRLGPAKPRRCYITRQTSCGCCLVVDVRRILLELWSVNRRVGDRRSGRQGFETVYELSSDTLLLCRKSNKLGRTFQTSTTG